VKLPALPPDFFTHALDDLSVGGARLVDFGQLPCRSTSITPESASTWLATLKQTSESAQLDGAAVCFGASCG